VRAAFAGLVVDGVAAPPNYSVLATDGGVLFLYRSQEKVLRARTPGRVVAALASHLGTHLDDPSSMVRLDAAVAVRGGRAVLLGRTFLAHLEALEPRLRRAGWALADLPWAPVDPGSGEVVIAPPAVVARAEAGAGPGRSDPPVAAPGRYPVDRWLLFDPFGDQPASAGQRLAAPLAAVVNAAGVGGQAALDAVARLAPATVAVADLVPATVLAALP
jgi:hypothetical protein